MHSIRYGYSPTAFLELWPFNVDRSHDHNLRHHEDFILPNIRLELFRRMPAYSLLYEWNSSGDVRFQNNRTTFRIALSNTLIDELNTL